LAGATDRQLHLLLLMPLPPPPPFAPLSVSAGGHTRASEQHLEAFIGPTKGAIHSLAGRPVVKSAAGQVYVSNSNQAHTARLSRRGRTGAIELRNL